MWTMIAEPGLRCAECRHTIRPGRLCLSELPEEMPAGVSRSDFRNYCIGCPECWRQGRHACYVRHLESGHGVGTTPRSLPCARCGRRIPAGEKAGVQTYYDWPDALENETNPRNGSLTSGAGSVSTAAGLDVWIRGVPSGTFDSLSESLEQKFVRAGLGDDRGVRTLTEAETFYRDSIPYPVRNLGEDAIRRFTHGKEASHVVSAHNAPELVDRPGNLVWEDAALNRSRGAADMTGWEEFRAHGTNAFDATGIVFRDCFDAASATTLFAGLLEAPVSIAENVIHYRKGRKTGEATVKDAATAIAKRAAVGTVGFAVTGAVALAGAGPLIVTIAPVLLPVGIALYGYTGLKRILSALDDDLSALDNDLSILDDDLPLNRVGTYFCSLRCHTRFAYETGKSALMRWETSRSGAPAT